MKLYIVVRQDLRPGSQIAQAIHAFREYVEKHPESEREWYSNSNTIVVLGCNDEQELWHLWKNAPGFAAEFREPDFDDELTAVAFQPGNESALYLSHLNLALKQVL